MHNEKELQQPSTTRAMKNTTVGSPAQYQPTEDIYLPVEVSITFNPLAGPVITVEKKYQEKGNSGPADPANIQLGKGHWQVNFRLDSGSGLSFSKGPVLLGIEEPQTSDTNPIAFAVTRASSDVRVLRFEFPDDDGPTFQYAIRVHESTGVNHMIDPKVINRGEPSPTPPLLTD